MHQGPITDAELDEITQWEDVSQLSDWYLRDWAKLLAREVQRLRKLATWHDRPRVRITKEGPHFELEGHLLRTLRSEAGEYEPQHKIMLYGRTDPEWWDVADVEIISQPEEQ